MSLKKKIVRLLMEEDREVSISELYTRFPEQPKTTVRGRVYDAIGDGIKRVGKGLYISAKAIIEHGNSLELVDRMVAEGGTFDFVFLDIPYAAGGQRSWSKNGGNRDLFACDKISPEQFGNFMSKCEQLLKTDKSPLLFMFTSGRSSEKERREYLSALLDNTQLKECNRRGSYQKMWSTGNPMNMGKYTMPAENIYIFTKSGEVADMSAYELDFRLVPNLKEYPTAKPYPMIESLVQQFTKVGEWCFDPFGGSGKILKACLKLGRLCHIIDSSEESINNHILKLA